MIKLFNFLKKQKIGFCKRLIKSLILSSFLLLSLSFKSFYAMKPIIITRTESCFDFRDILRQNQSEGRERTESPIFEEIIRASSVENLASSINQFSRNLTFEINLSDCGIESSFSSDGFDLTDRETQRPITNFRHMRKIELTEKQKLVVIGDIHARYQTVKEIIKIIDSIGGFDDLDELILNNDFIVVFLGDYVDRGSEDILVLNFILSLKEANPFNVFLLKGNHEAYPHLNIPYKARLNSQGEGKRQVYTENPLMQKISPKTLPLKKIYNKFFNFLSEILFVEYKEKIIMLSHGGVLKELTGQIREFLSSKHTMIAKIPDQTEDYFISNRLINPLTKKSIWTKFIKKTRNLSFEEYLFKKRETLNEYVIQNELIPNVNEWYDIIKTYSENIVLFLRGHDHSLPTLYSNQSLSQNYGYVCCKPDREIFKLLTIISGPIYEGSRCTRNLFGDPLNFYPGIILITPKESTTFPFNIEYFYKQDYPDEINSIEI